MARRPPPAPPKSGESSTGANRNVIQACFPDLHVRRDHQRGPAPRWPQAPPDPQHRHPGPGDPALGGSLPHSSGQARGPLPGWSWNATAHEKDLAVADRQATGPGSETAGRMQFLSAPHLHRRAQERCGGSSWGWSLLAEPARYTPDSCTGPSWRGRSRHPRVILLAVDHLDLRRLRGVIGTAADDVEAPGAAFVVTPAVESRRNSRPPRPR